MSTALISTQEVNEYLKSQGVFDKTGVYHMSVSALNELGFSPEFQTKIGTYWDAQTLPKILESAQEALPKKKPKMKQPEKPTSAQRFDAIEQKLDQLIGMWQNI